VPEVSSISSSGGARGVVYVQVGTLSRHRVCELSLCPSACLFDDPLQLKHVTFVEVPESKDRRARIQGGDDAIFVSRRGY
jgi:hypothetical protein